MAKINVAAGLGFLALCGGCAPAIVWDRPNTTQEEFAADNARCQLFAEGVTPDPGTPTIYTGKVGRDVALNIAAGLAHGIEQTAAVPHKHDLCMQAAGYAGRPVGAPQLALAAEPAPGSPTPLAPAPYPAVVAAAPPPGRAVVAPPPPQGRVVLFPVTIYNEYHPHWTVSVADAD